MNMNLNRRQRLGGGAFIVSALVFLLSAHAGAFPPGPMQEEGIDMKRRNMPPFHISPCGIWQDPEMVQDLGLTGEQMKALRDADLLFIDKHLELKAQLERQHFEMEKAFSAEILDEVTVREVAKKIADLEGKLSIQFIESLLAREKILNSDQRKKLKAFEWGRHVKHERQKGRERLPDEKERPRR
jgi:Spy/CpxP family protein refolding chaperone